MSVYKKIQINGQMSRYYYYEFNHNGKRYRGSTGMENENEAKKEQYNEASQSLLDKAKENKDYTLELSLIKLLDLEAEKATLQRKLDEEKAAL